MYGGFDEIEVEQRTPVTGNYVSPEYDGFLARYEDSILPFTNLDDKPAL